MVDQQKQLVILHIDDNPDDLELIRMLLNQQMKNSKIVGVDSSELALRLLGSSCFDCVLCDYQMPGEDGMTILQKLRKFDQETPFIFLTGQGSEEIAANALREGADDYFTKGAGTAYFERLANTISRLVREHEERKGHQQSLEALNKSELRYRDLFYDSLDAVFMVDVEGNIVDFNPIALEMFGYEMEEVYELNAEVLHSTVQQRQQYIKELMFKGRVKDYDLVLRKKDGTFFPALVTATIQRDDYGNPVGIQGICRDITKFKEFEEQLKRRGDQLDRHARELQSYYNISRIIEDPNQEIKSVLTAVIAEINTTLTAYANHCVCIQTKSGTVLSENCPASTECFALPIELSEKKYGTISVLAKNEADGSTLSELDKKMLATIADQLAIFLDRHETLAVLRESEQQLRESEERLSSLFNNVPVGLYRTNPEGDILMANPALVSLVKFDSFEELARINLNDDTDLTKRFDREKFLERVENENSFIVETEWIAKDGSHLAVIENVSAVRDSEGKVKYIEGVIQDITERRLLELERSQSQKMQAIGQLAAGIAHEINTPMQFISDNIHFLEKSFEKIRSLADTLGSLPETYSAQEAAEQLEYIAQQIKENKLKYIFEEIPSAIADSLDGVETVSKIVLAMKSFSHPGSDEKQLVNIHTQLDSVITVSRNEWKYVAEIKKDYDESLPQVPCLPRELNQVALNLIINAAQAIGDALGDDPIDKGTITVSTRRKNNLAEIRISDTGSGIAEENLERIFEPFFTTKEIGVGSGQGLAISYDIIVKKHGGSIRVDSKPGRGTTFIISLPLKSKDKKEVIV